SSGSRIDVLRTPGGGIQPRAAVDEHGTLHLVYFEGDPAKGDLEYVRSSDGGKTFGTPVKVASAPNAVALGNVRGAELAVGRGGRVHVVWNGAAGGKALGAPRRYARLDDSGVRFEPERDLAGEHHGLDGGGAVAADAAGNVWVVWQAPDGAPGGKGESGRRVFVARSRDDGATFEHEVAASASGSG